MAAPSEDRSPRRGAVFALLIIGTILSVAVVTFGVLRPREPLRTPIPIGPPKGEIAVAYPYLPLTLNPYTFEGETIATHDLLRPVMPSLLAVGPDVRYRPALAERVPSGKDVGGVPFSVTYHLDKRATWSDGRAVTADDVRFTWEAILDRRFPVADRSPYEHVEDVVALDEHTVRLVFGPEPYGWWPNLFSAGDFVLPRHDLEGKDLGAELVQGVRVGAGPFVVESWTPGLEIVYAANPHWWGPGPGLERVRVFFVPDPEMALQLLERDRVQVVALTTEPNLRRRLREVPGVHVSARFGSAWWELQFQNGRPVSRELAFRQAVAAAVDRQGIVEAFVHEDGRALNSLTPGWQPGRSDMFAALELDRERAKQLLVDGRITPGPAALAGPVGSELVQLMERAIQAGVAEIGVHAEIGNADSDRFYGRWLQEGRFDLAVVERRGSPLMPLEGRYRSTLQPPDGVNYARLNSAAVDEALDAITNVTKLDSTLPDFVTRRLAAALPALPLLEAKAYLAFRPPLLGPSANATVDGPFWNLGEWRLAPGP